MLVHGLTPEPLPGVASLGNRPTVEDAGRVLLGLDDLGHDDAGERRSHRVEVLDLHARQREQVGQFAIPR